MDEDTLLLLLKAFYRGGKMFLQALEEVIKTLERKTRNFTTETQRAQRL